MKASSNKELTLYQWVKPVPFHEFSVLSHLFVKGI